MTGSAGADEIWGGGFGGLSGSGFDDDLVGDSISGGAGNDIIYGGWRDTLAGGAGTDTLDLDLAGVQSLGTVTNVTGTGFANFTIQGTSFEGNSTFSITAREFEVAVVGFTEYTLFNEFKAALLAPL